MKYLTFTNLCIALALVATGCAIGWLAGCKRAEVPTVEPVDLEGSIDVGIRPIPRFISYWEAVRQPYLEQAAEETGYDVRVENCDRAGRIKITTYDERRDLGPFWERYYELVAEAEEVIRQ